jgi:hypothetical protein
MTDLADIKNIITVEETRFRAAVSESTFQRVGQTLNFINHRNHQEKAWFLNGDYGPYAPQTYVDGMTFFEFDATIIDVFMFVGLAGSGGTTELDIKVASTPGGSFASIFSTTPKIQAAAGSGIWIHVGSSVPNTTAPVLSTTTVNANWGLRLDLVTGQTLTGFSGSTGAIIIYRPR